jgi:phage gpG-like protein
MNLKIRGVAVALSRIEAAQKKLLPGGALEDIVKDSAQDVDLFISDRFRLQTDPADMAWSPLSDATIEARERKLLLGQTRGVGAAWAEMTRGQRQAASMKSAKKKWYTKSGKIRKGAATKLKKNLDRGGFKILIDTGRLRNSCHAWAEGMIIKFGSDASYFLCHQTGTHWLPERRIMPVVLTAGKWMLDTDGAAGRLWENIRNKIKALFNDGSVRRDNTATAK